MRNLPVRDDGGLRRTGHPRGPNRPHPTPGIPTTLQNRSESPVRAFRPGWLRKGPRSVAFVEPAARREAIVPRGGFGRYVRGMEPHYHVWIRAGKIFSMRERRFESRKTAHKAAVKLKPASEDRLVLACEACPATRPSKRKAPRWGAIASRLAARFELPAGEFREALAAELAAERGR